MLLVVCIWYICSLVSYDGCLVFWVVRFVLYWLFVVRHLAFLDLDLGIISALIRFALVFYCWMLCTGWGVWVFVNLCVTTCRFVYLRVSLLS